MRQANGSAIGGDTAGGRRGGEPFLGQRRGHARAGADLRLEVALRPEPVIGLDHGGARKTELAGQGAGRGQSRARAEAAGEHSAAHLLIELEIERNVVVLVEIEPGNEAGGPAHYPSSSGLVESSLIGTSRATTCMPS